MTHDVLQSDIELAERMIEASRPDIEIIAALDARRIDRSRATQLVQDLRSGKKVEPDPISRPPAESGQPLASESGRNPKNPQTSSSGSGQKDRNLHSHRRNSAGS